MAQQTILVKDLPDYEQVIDYDTYSTGIPRLVAKHAQTLEGEIFFRLITQHPGIFLQLQKEGEDTAGRAFYQELDAAKLVDKAALVSELAVETMISKNWLCSPMSEMDARKAVEIARELAKNNKLED